MPVTGRPHHTQVNRMWPITNCAPLATSRRRFQFVATLLYTDSLNQDIQAWIDQLRSGDTRALSRAISTVETRAPARPNLLKSPFPPTGKPPLLQPPTAPA